MIETHIAQTNSTTELAVLLVGAWEGDGPGDCPAAIVEALGPARTLRVADLDGAAACLDVAGQWFDVIVLLESRPGQFPAAAIDLLRHRAPLARVWRLLGSWCEGEERSGRPPAGCTSSYWHQWPPRAAREFSAAGAGRCPGWGLPLTSTADERALAAAEVPIEPGTGLVVVGAARAAAAAALADVCRLAGYETLIVADGSHFSAPDAKVVLWDAPVERACDAAQVRQLRRAAGDAPLLVLVGFPRPDDSRRAIEAGVSAVISKPFMVRDLLGHVAQAAAAAVS